MKVFMVIDMQEKYVGNKRNRKIFQYKSEELIGCINERIKEYAGESVIYIRNIARDNWINRRIPVCAVEGTQEAELVEGLEIVNRTCFTKYKGDAFTNNQLRDFLKEMGVTEIEVAGVDGGGCVALTALGAIEAGYKTTLNKKCIGTILDKKARKLGEKLKGRGAVFL